MTGVEAYIEFNRVECPIPERFLAASIERQTQLLKDWLVRNNLAFDDRPQVARYDAPLTLPGNRRNEILIPLKGM